MLQRLRRHYSNSRKKFDVGQKRCSDRTASAASA
jgi:hypothetical protein